jgi:hypothetical protein
MSYMDGPVFIHYCSFGWYIIPYSLAVSYLGYVKAVRTYPIKQWIIK